MVKLLAVPDDDIVGDGRAGAAMRAGYFLFRGQKLPIDRLDFARPGVGPAFSDYLHGFRWLRDLSVSASRVSGLLLGRFQYALSSSPLSHILEPLRPSAHSAPTRITSHAVAYAHAALHTDPPSDT